MYTLIGDGRVARHFSHYFKLIGLSFVRWWRNTQIKPGTDRSLETAVDASSHVLILITDSEIDSFIQSHECLEGKYLIHFSGSLISKHALSAHPLLSFTKELYPEETYSKIPFVLEEGRGSFEEILPGLNNPHFYISPAHKALYHALCVMSGNFTTVLWNKLFEEFEGKIGLPRETAYLYLERIMLNLQNRDVPALTGPLARKDIATLASNLESLSGDPFIHIYQGFLKAFGLSERIKKRRK